MLSGSDLPDLTISSELMTCHLLLEATISSTIFSSETAQCKCAFGLHGRNERNIGRSVCRLGLEDKFAWV